MDRNFAFPKPRCADPEKVYGLGNPRPSTSRFHELKSMESMATVPEANDSRVLQALQYPSSDLPRPKCPDREAVYGGIDGALNSVQVDLWNNMPAVDLPVTARPLGVLQYPRSVSLPAAACDDRATLGAPRGGSQHPEMWNAMGPASEAPTSGPLGVLRYPPNLPTPSCDDRAILGAPRSGSQQPEMWNAMGPASEAPTSGLLGVLRYPPNLPTPSCDDRAILGAPRGGSQQPEMWNTMSPDLGDELAGPLAILRYPKQVHDTKFGRMELPKPRCANPAEVYGFSAGGSLTAMYEER